MASADKALEKAESALSATKEKAKDYLSKLQEMRAMDSGIPKLADTGIAVGVAYGAAYVDGVMSGDGKPSHNVTGGLIVAGAVGAIAGTLTGHPTIAGSSLDVLTGAASGLAAMKGFAYGKQAKLDRAAEKAAKAEKDAAKA